MQGPLNRPGPLVNSIVPRAQAAGTVNGASLDVAQYEAVLVLISVGTIPSACTLDVTVEESDDDSTFTAVPNAVATQYTNTRDDRNEIGVVRTTGRKRYIRPVGVAGGASPVPFGVVLLPVLDRTAEGTTYAFSV
jgi:hypothetical protein